MGTDRMIPRYVYKPFTVKFRDKCEWQNRIKPHIKGGLVWNTDRSKTNKGTHTGVHRWGSRSGQSFSLGLHTTIFQVEIYAIKACVMENTEKGYRHRNIYILSDSQAAIKALDSFQTNSELVWGCHQSLVKLAEHTRIPTGMGAGTHGD
jgi:hypothetical protein